MSRPTMPMLRRTPGGAPRCALLTFLALLLAGSASHGQGAAFPDRLEKYFASAGALSASERQQLMAGQPITKMLDADQSKEVAVLGAIWVGAPMKRYVAAVTDIERFETGTGFNVTRKISATPRLADFADLRLPADDLDDLADCRVGDCAIKLGEGALKRFRSEIDWKSPTAHDAANALMRQLSLGYVTEYLKGGNDTLAVYRDAADPTYVAREFKDMVDRMPELTNEMPNLRRYLLGYPRVTLPNATSFLYWQEVEFGLKPTIRISHLTIRETPEDTVVASKMLYASHYFWTGLEIRALVPDPSRGEGFWFVTVSRSRTDGLSGFTGRIVRRRVRSGAEQGVRAGLEHTKRRLEQAR